MFEGDPLSLRRRSALCRISTENSALSMAVEWNISQHVQCVTIKTRQK
jgi:hypothetical protein